MMAKRAIEEEFDRLYSEFIENPEVLPRLKKRAKRCGQWTESPRHQASSSSSIKDVAGSLSTTDTIELDSPITTECPSSVREEKASVSSSTERRISRQHDDTKNFQPQKSCPTFTASVSSSPPVTKTDDPEVASDSIQPTQPGIDDVIDDVINSSHCKNDVGDIRAGDQLREDISQGANDIFMLHKPRLNRVKSQPKALNLDALWALYAKTWLLPKHFTETQSALPPFLQRNLRRGCIFFKRYLIQQKALKELTKTKLSSSHQAAAEHQRSISTKTEAVVIKEAKTKEATDDCQDSKQLKLEGKESIRAQKRKDGKPNKPNQIKTDSSKVTSKRWGQDAVTKATAVKPGKLTSKAKTGLGNGCASGQDAVAKATALKSGKLTSKTKIGLRNDSGRGPDAVTKATSAKSEKLPVKTGPQKDSEKVRQTRKQSLRKEDSSSRNPLSTASSKQVWTKEASGGRQVAICRPNTKGKSPKAEAASTSEVKLKPVQEESPKRQLSSVEQHQEKAQAQSSEDTVLAAEESEDIGVSSGIKPLFPSKVGGHCGGIWKSIVDEC